MSTTGTGEAAGGLLLRNYNSFRGVDYTNYEVSLYRSPDAKNMWKNYKSLGKGIETRPDIEVFLKLKNTIYGLFFYTISQVEHMIIHCGVSLYDYNMNTKEMKTLKESGMNPRRSQSFIYQNLFYIKDGINYLVYDGNDISEVTGYIPITSISRKPIGGGTIYDGVNMLSKYRKNSFCSDGKSTLYDCDVEMFTSSIVRVWVNNQEVTKGFSVNAGAGTVTFEKAPEKPLTDGQDNVIIQFEKEVTGYRERINKCTLLAVFDDRVFFSGNQDYPNVLWHCSLNDPTYVVDTDYYNEGLDLSPVKALVPGNNALWVFKEPSQANTTVFYHTPSPTHLNDVLVNVYPCQHSSITTGCVASGINFNDDIVFFSDRGMEGITGDITTEQVIAHRSTLVDSKMTTENNYKDMILQEWEGYLLVIIENKIYLADSRCLYTNQNHNEYEWFYWELSKKIRSATVKNNILYLCSVSENDESAIYTLTKENAEIDAYWTTCLDGCGYPQMQKTTNKRGCVIDMTGEKVKLEVKTDKEDFEEIDTFVNTKDYIVPRIKKKKWKDIQLRLSSDVPFALERIYLECYIGSYIKR